MPALRELAASAGSPASSTRVSRPPRASSQAALTPVRPPPTITTSAFVGNGPGSACGAFGSRAASIQYGISLKSGAKIASSVMANPHAFLQVGAVARQAEDEGKVDQGDEGVDLDIGHGPIA